MALSSLQLRRTLSGLSTLHRSLSATASALSAPRSSASPLLQAAQIPASSPQSWTLLPLQSRAFRSSCLSSARSTSYMGNDPKDEIGPDTILFEGCDYNHWLFVMEFPKEKNISPEEMVRTYEETCAKGLNISVEEAKQKMYACSTTTYTGFQAVMTEQEAEKFNDFREVIFVLPDSYIDPANKEYGGDKYINGTIIPRPPPVQYGRQGSRHRDRNRYPDPPRHDRQGPMVNHQGNPSYGQQGPMQVGGNHGASQHYPQQNYGPPRQGDNRAPIPVNTPGGSAMHQPGRDPIPSYQGNYSQGRQQSYYPQEQRNFQQGDQRNYAPPGQGGYRGENMDFGRPHTETQGQGSGGFQGQETARSLGQGPSSGSYGQGPSSGAYGQGPSSGAYGQGPNSGAYGQGPNSGAYGQGPNSGAYGQGPRSEAYGQGPRSEAYGQGPSYGAFGQGPNSGASGHGQSYPVHGGDQRFSQREQRNVQGEQGNYAPHGTDGH